MRVKVTPELCDLEAAHTLSFYARALDMTCQLDHDYVLQLRIEFSILQTSDLEAPTSHKLREVFDGQNKARTEEGGQQGSCWTTTHSRFCWMGPIRSSSRKKPAAATAATAVAASHDVDFVHLWRQLAAVGWKSKRPRGIEREWRCSSPDKTHVLVGESAVVNFAFESGLLKDSEEGDVVQEEEDAVQEGGVNTVDGIFCPSSDNDVKLTQAAVMRAFGLSLGDRQDHDDGSDAAGAAAGFGGTSFRRRLQDVKDDANILQDGEGSCDYVNYSSGVSDDDGMCDDEVEPGCGQLSNDEDVLSDSDTVEMDTAFFTSLQVGNSALSRAAVNNREEILRGMTWTAVSSEYESDTPAYPRLGSDEARPLGELLDV
ncbi:unnamed protein product [Phytophthora fragariaefolia]|uniref:Unnamed protein product n=1 Tax=Phytophthora fragariaefolia TaxID=1490495 RepID=A0A9W6X605_9STRA|nr:unnamed protein product [Phytophthora fragariaefolia]